MRFSPLLLATLLASTSSALFAGDVTIYGIKKVNTPTNIDVSDIVAAHRATVVDETTRTITLKVPEAAAEQLRSVLASDFASIEIRDDFDRIDLAASPIDVRMPPTFPQGWTRNVTTSSTGRDLFLVQFATVAHQEWIDALTAAGGTIIEYLPTNAYLVFGYQERLRKSLSNAPVQWFGIHQPVHRIAGPLRAAADDFSDVRVVIANVPEADEAVRLLEQNAIEELNATSTLPDRTIYAKRVATAALRDLAANPSVIWIERATKPVLSGEREVHLAAGDTLVTNSGGVLAPAVGNYRTWLSSRVSAYKTNAKVAVLDIGFDLGDSNPATVHKDFLTSTGSSFVTVVNYTQNDQAGANYDCMGHGTMVAGVVGGNAGATNATTTSENSFYMGLGMAPEIPVVAGRIFNYKTGSTIGYDPQPWTMIYGDLASRSVPITSNSWNDYSDSSYNTNSQTLDKIVRHVDGTDTGSPMSIYIAAGNYDQVTGTTNRYVIAPANGKNITSVGGSENYHTNTTWTDYPGGLNRGTYADNGNEIWSNSLYGTPTNDARFKPDVVAPATAIEAPRTQSTATCLFGATGPVIDPTSPTREQHLWSRGTSFSSPLAAGGGALLYSWFKTKTGVAPSPALLKAMQVTLAYDLPTEPAAPSTKQGFGKVDLTRGFQTDGRYKWIDQTTVLGNGGIAFLPALGGYYTIKDTTKPVKITLVWTDRAGATGVNKTLVNDLDLVVVGANGGQFAVGNSVNATTRRSNLYTSGAVFDRTNNVEQVVLLSNDVGTSFSVQVDANTVTADGINAWNGTTAQQDFALFIENVIGD